MATVCVGAAGIRCHACGRRVDATRVASSRPRDFRHPHRGPICARCWLRENVTALKRGPRPVSAPGTPDRDRLITARQARAILGIPLEWLYAAEALGLIHPTYMGRPAGRRPGTHPQTGCPCVRRTSVLGVRHR